MTALLLFLFFLAGATALIYEVVWMRQCSVLFGNGAQAAAMALAIFFGGLALGNRLFGVRAARSPNPLRLWAILEAAVAGSAVGCLALVDVFHMVYAAVAPVLFSVPAAITAVKVLLATALLLPAAIFLGGTFPAMAEHLTQDRAATARVASLVYGLNTLGAAAGALVAGFFLPPVLGFRGTCLFAAAVNALIAGLGFGLSQRSAPRRAEAAAAGRPAEASWRELTAVAAVSGFAAVGLEVLWTVMFAQVLHNSVYSFAIIMATFLFALAGGGILAYRLTASGGSPAALLSILATSAGLAVALTPFLFHRLTRGLRYVAASAGWADYLANVGALAAAVMLVPGVLMGTVFPYVFCLARGAPYAPGELIGRLTAANTIGAVVGSLTAGFVAVPWLGVWGSIRTAAALYLLLAIVVARSASAAARGWTLFAPAVGLLLTITVLDPSRLPKVLIDRGRGEVLLDVAESGAGIVAVVERAGHRYLKVDNYYSLGGTASQRYEQTQGDLPLLLHPQPRSALFIGVGTGITAGAALSHPVERVTAVELLPDVAAAARRYFAANNNGLFTDSRSAVVVGDGRQYLLARAERYDVIVGDLFVPWHAGESGLYTREQFELARARLAPGGLFAQWLPLYQLTREDTAIIVRTMLSVFPTVTLWRGDFLPNRPIVALIGSQRSFLDVAALVERFRIRRGASRVERETALGMIGLFYAGNLGAVSALFEGYPVNTDDRPIITYRAPVAQRQQRVGRAAFFTSDELMAWYREIFRLVPPESDPYLVELTDREKGFVRAGLALFEAGVHRKQGREAEARRAAERFADLAPEDIQAVYGRQWEENRTGSKDSAWR